ncbi:OB-fold domain-containing protein [Alphaproteobacteria bacterium]|nr:OB-fold domain-containing protein [Alphaproteobacteria bacterium]
MIQYDPVVEKYQFYPRAVSVFTGRQNLEWREATGKGSLYSFTDIHVAPPGFEDLTPYMIGVIELDEGVRMMTPLQGIKMDDAVLGMRMRVGWQKLSDGITYPAFEPDW